MKKILIYIITLLPFLVIAQVQNGTTIPNVSSTLIPSIAQLSGGSSDTTAVNAASANNSIIRIYIQNIGQYFSRVNSNSSWYRTDLIGSVAFNSAITAGAEGTATATITGAAVNDVFNYSLGTTDLPTGVVVKSVRVTAANTVVVTLTNTTASTQTPNVTIYLKR